MISDITAVRAAHIVLASSSPRRVDILKNSSEFLLSLPGPTSHPDASQLLGIHKRSLRSVLIRARTGGSQGVQQQKSGEHEKS